VRVFWDKRGTMGRHLWTSQFQKNDVSPPCVVKKAGRSQGAYLKESGSGALLPPVGQPLAPHRLASIFPPSSEEGLFLKGFHGEDVEKKKAYRESPAFSSPPLDCGGKEGGRYWGGSREGWSRPRGINRSSSPLQASLLGLLAKIKV